MENGTLETSIMRLQGQIDALRHRIHELLAGATTSPAFADVSAVQSELDLITRELERLAG